MNMQNYLFLLCLISTFACQTPEESADAYGNFEAKEIIVSSEANGKIIWLDIEEGKILKKDQLIGIIDTTQLYLKKLQLLASIKTVKGKTQNVKPRIKVLEEQKRNLLREQKRITALLKDKAATPKQLDDITGQIEVVEREIAATLDQNKTLNQGILGELDPIKVQIQQIEDQIAKSYLHNPINGRVLTKYSEAHEMTSVGKPLYKIADLREMTLRAYISGVQLPQVKIGQDVQILIDEDENNNQSFAGTITWIADQAEFTPKIVQTKEERVNLVYAIKVKVINNGSLKIGMPGEVIF